ncbi:hypothetical protein EAS64_10500 [Trebonia kvetii]|uniref:Alpha/beta hydrolase n=1 Tax=Trebonia kvetii TaxID=2480626 RepID=A0A6P2C0X9_9ACTN|nr:hypothetical protein [Trebonia kvetii]TVZ05042.1 hypothetical protein EAS64_10500 [Trebonia kvetii]
MTAIIGIHGIRNEQLGRNQLIPEWAGALADGLERAAGHEVAVPDLNIVYYGDLFEPDPAGKDAGDELAGLTEEDAVALSPFADEVTGRLASGPPADGEPAAKGRTAVPLLLQAVLRRLDKQFGSPKASLLFLGELKQVRSYLLDPEVKAEVDNRAENVITRGGRVLIGHSLGSVVAFEFIRQHPGYPVDLLLTLGSPLGLRTLRALMPDPDYGAGGLPPGVTRWVGLRDPRDPVACAGDLSRYWPGVCDFTVHNQSDAHSVYRYLSKRPTGTALLAALPGLADYEPS